MPRIKVQERHLEAARLYLSGPPGLQGNWRASCHRAGFERAPALDNETSQEALEQVKAAESEPDEDLERLEALLESANPSWEELALVARKVLGKIGAGMISPNQGQVSSLKEIIQRAEGRVGSQGGGEELAGIVVLPALVDQEGVPYLDPELDEVEMAERLNKLARRDARKDHWAAARTMPGGPRHEGDEREPVAAGSDA